MTTWIKKDGETEIELNDAPETIKKAESLGWTRKKEKAPAKGAKK